MVAADELPEFATQQRYLQFQRRVYTAPVWRPAVGRGLVGEPFELVLSGAADPLYALFRAGRLEVQPPPDGKHRPAVRTQSARRAKEQHDCKLRSGQQPGASGAGAGRV